MPLCLPGGTEGNPPFSAGHRGHEAGPGWTLGLGTEFPPLAPGARRAVPAPSVLMTLAPCASITSRQLAAPLMAARWNLEVRGERSAAGWPARSHRPARAVGTHADLPSGSSLVGTSPLRAMREATRAASSFSTAWSSRSSLLPQSWLWGHTQRTVGLAAADPSPPAPAGALGSCPPPPALAWRLPLAAGFGRGQGPQGGQEPRSVGLSRSCRGRWSWAGA